jgi:hypothetical protein
MTVFCPNPGIGYKTYDDAMASCPDGYRLPSLEEFQDLIDEKKHKTYWDEASKCRVFENVEVEEIPQFSLDLIDPEQELHLKDGLTTSPILDKFGNPIIYISKQDAAEIMEFFSKRDGRKYTYPKASHFKKSSKAVNPVLNKQGYNYMNIYVQDDENQINSVNELISVLPFKEPDKINYKYPQLGIKPTVNLGLVLAQYGEN